MNYNFLTDFHIIEVLIWYDGPRAGSLHYNSKLCAFIQVDETETHGIYKVVEATQEEFDNINQDNVWDTWNDIKQRPIIGYIKY